MSEDHLTHPKYRADIDGLRAIAILLVMGFHAFPKIIQGGFVGVDIFFVISGFLISTIMFGSLERDSFSFVEFYSRRIRRIFPALLIVIISSFIFGWFALFPDEFKQLSKHIAGGSVFISNFILLKESGYFDTIAETKPLLHLWSLGIEEQFYIFYPLLLWLAWKRKFNLLTITIIIALISFGINLKQFKTNPVLDFYSPQTRFWELMIGAILAYLTFYKKAISTEIELKIDYYLGRVIYAPTNIIRNTGAVLKNSQSILGLILIIIAVIRVNKERYFPGVWALLPTLGAALLIVAGSKAWINRVILSNKILVWFGLISFPLYLWHWVFLSFATIMEDGVSNKKIRIIAIAISILLAWLTTKFVERPLRFGGYNKAKTIGLIIVMIIIGALGYNNFKGKWMILNHIKTFNEQLLNSRSQFGWPNLDHKADCIDKFGLEFQQYCMIDDVTKKPEMMLLGDSNANHLFYGLNKFTQGKNLLNLGKGGCLPFLGVTTRLIEGEQRVVKT